MRTRKVIITSECIVHGLPRKIGDVLPVQDDAYNTLISQNQALPYTEPAAADDVDEQPVLMPPKKKKGSRKSGEEEEDTEGGDTLQ